MGLARAARPRHHMDLREPRERRAGRDEPDAAREKMGAGGAAERVARGKGERAGGLDALRAARPRPLYLYRCRVCNNGHLRHYADEQMRRLTALAQRAVEQATFDLLAPTFRRVGHQCQTCTIMAVWLLPSDEQSAGTGSPVCPSSHTTRPVRSMSQSRRCSVWTAPLHIALQSEV